MYNYSYLDHHRLSPVYFNKNTLSLAQDLLGKYLVSTKNGLIQIGEIIETEAYIGIDDLASHASHGKTKRNQIMWGPPGHIYVYLVYGIHHLMNIITEPIDHPAAVLIRALKPIQNIKTKTNGPGKLTKALNITLKDHGLNLLDPQNKELFIVDLGIKPKKIIKTPRVGINYAPEPWLSKPWRFYSPTSTKSGK